MMSQTRIFSELVRDHLRDDCLMVRSKTPLAELLSKMTLAKATSAMVVDGDERLLGLITEQDVTRRIALRCEGNELVDSVMTTPVRTIGATDYLYSAIARMRRFGWRHMPVVEETGRVAGAIDLCDALAAAGEDMLRRVDTIAHEHSKDGLREVKSAQVALAADLIADSVPAPEIQSLLTRINGDIHRRILDLEITDMKRTGWGDPPVAFCAIVMGSGGRGENFLYPDQDNGFILDDYPDDRHGQVDAFFVELATRMTRDLDDIGFPYCKGYVMATNPLWRKSRTQWRDQIGRWGRKRSTIAIQLADIFFDFRPVYGKAAMAGELRQRVTGMARSSPALLTELNRETERMDVALGWFGRLVTEKENVAFKGKINLKHMGTLPLVSAIRLLCLQAGIAETSTLERIAGLHERAVLNNNEADYLRGAFVHVTGLLLRQQIADFTAGREVNNYVHPDAMSKRERDILIGSFKAISDLKDRVRARFTGEIF
ncbi:putative nucleotidyltransferase substrate binding domain-containing protein [Pelagibius sp. Alg239-R121]|uniref:putative nucleotidyltransferase substrate binding domain-containing protein n=1 Tax=Pelagibius sp. Alg239-R121 TaxID=2993448 RepID=UPI0024A63B52|nr:putative nucleotidyltransferase substrate binding domain-containing protein [Pelagibius sp. Alg239-R121]